MGIIVLVQFETDFYKSESKNKQNVVIQKSSLYSWGDDSFDRLPLWIDTTLDVVAARPTFCFFLKADILHLPFVVFTFLEHRLITLQLGKCEDQLKCPKEHKKIQHIHIKFELSVFI